jgi:acetyl-CoA acetyltransferase
MTAMTFNSGRTVLDQTLEACMLAIEDSGMPAKEIDGLITFGLYQDSVSCSSVAAGLALRDVSYYLEYGMGGQAAAFMVLHAAMAVREGLANHVLVFRSLNGRSGNRIGRHLDHGGSTDYRYPAGMVAYPQIIAQFVQRYLIETGSSEEDLGALVLAQREYAQRNPRALRKKAITLEEYMSQPYITTPFRAADCAIEVDGAAAIVVSRADRTYRSDRPKIKIRGGVFLSREMDLDLGGSHHWSDYSRCFAHFAAEPLWSKTRMTPRDIDVAEIYDCFSGLAMMSLEGFGFCGRGEAGSFIRSGETSRDGSLPMNTHGGLLAEGYLHGMNTVVEGVRQLHGCAGENQIKDAATVFVSSGGRVAGSAVVLERDDS